MAFLDCVFVERKWTTDRASIERTFGRIVGERVPIWLVSFVEGTRVTERKIERSRQYAREHDLPELRHLLVPRTKGFVATVEGLRVHLDAVYDVTIGYVGGVPTLWQYTKGFAHEAHLHVRRFPIASLPEPAEELAEWLVVRFAEKDALLDHYYRYGAFPP